MNKEIKEKIIDILEYWGRQEKGIDRILELFEEEKEKWINEMENWLKESDITKPSSTIVATLYRRLQGLKK